MRGGGGWDETMQKRLKRRWKHRWAGPLEHPSTLLLSEEEEENSSRREQASRGSSSTETPPFLPVTMLQQRIEHLEDKVYRWGSQGCQVP
mmetsp:Transcript_16519/g.55140  ORF Transcript_16519/g.55140 Transcript_16519/m.55140 type:complete len:90 (+) Transcript_16519:1323-1592(+)